MLMWDSSWNLVDQTFRRDLGKLILISSLQNKKCLMISTKLKRRKPLNLLIKEPRNSLKEDKNLRESMGELIKELLLLLLRIKRKRLWIVHFLRYRGKGIKILLLMVCFRLISTIKYLRFIPQRSMRFILMRLRQDLFRILRINQ
jgi:hypothetical protein